MAGNAAWDTLICTPFTLDPATGRPEPLLTLSTGRAGQWLVGQSPKSVARMTINLMPVYSRVRAGINRFLAR